MSLSQTKNISINKLVIFSISLLIFFLFSIIFKVKEVNAQCSPSCTWGWCSYGECCQCDHGDDADGYGDVTCCNPPGPSGGGCSTYPVNGCAAEPTPTGGTATPTSTGTPTIPPPQPAEPIPGYYFPCNQTSDVEFHSLRPYQAGPCNKQLEDLALFCGTDFTIIDQIDILKVFTAAPGSVPPYTWEYTLEGEPIIPQDEQEYNYRLACYSCHNGVCMRRAAPCIPDPEINCESNDDCISECTLSADGTTEVCIFTVDRTKELAIDLSGAYLPIMGNTEMVVNSQDQTIPEGLNDAAKVNEYVSWYLNGLLGRAEYGHPIMGEEEGNKRVTTYSGPIKKLTAFESQIVKREEEVEKALVSLDCDPDADPPDPDCIRHDQIIGCRNGGDPTRCYPGSATRVRLSYWEDRFPPLRRAYDTLQDYLDAFHQWRDDTYWRLFSYIPFSSTEDRMGLLELASYTIHPPISGTVTILSSSIVSQDPSELFFAHMQESTELGKFLQQVFSPQDSDLDNPGPPPIYPMRPYCDLLEIRSNPGDNLFPTEFRATVEYTAQIECTYMVPGEGRLCAAATGGGVCLPLPVDNYVCSSYYDVIDCAPGEFCGLGCSAPGSCDGDLCGGYIYGGCCNGYHCEGYNPTYPYVPGTCTRDTITVGDFGTYTITCANTVPISFRTITKTPLAREVWGRLVAGPASVFKRFFPQIEDEDGRPIRRLWSIPAATRVAFTSLNGNTVYAGNPNTGLSGSEAEIYFPHIGGIHQYFLQCTQTLLRPKGYANPCLNDLDIYLDPITQVDICSEPCNPDPTNVNLAGVEAKCVDLATRWLGDGVGDPLEERCGYVISRALAAGVDPIFTVAIWLNESGASNYTGICEVLGGGNPGAGYCQRICDFGIIVDCSTNSGGGWNSMFETQLSAFLNLPGYYLSACGMDQARCPMEIFGSMFALGSCTPTDASNGYIGGIKGIYEWLAPGQLFPCYPIAVP